MDLSILAKLSADELFDKLKNEPDEELVKLFGSSSIKLGDTSVEVLWNRTSGIDLVVDMILANKFTNKMGKLRAINFLRWFGLKNSRTYLAYLHYLNDKAFDVCIGAMFGIVFFQKEEGVSIIKAWRDRFPPTSINYEKASRAIEALEKHDPYIFSPYFRDSRNVWTANGEGQ